MPPVNLVMCGDAHEAIELLIAELEVNLWVPWPLLGVAMLRQLLRMPAPTRHSAEPIAGCPRGHGTPFIKMQRSVSCVRERSHIYDKYIGHYHSI